MEIKEGEYIRTTQGYLGKYQKSVEGFDEFVDNEGVWILDTGDVIKHSFNIMDLVKVGDFVNFKKVIKTNCSLKYINDDAEYGEDEINNGLDLGSQYIYFDCEIESIITKEQLEDVKYEVK